VKRHIGIAISGCFYVGSKAGQAARWVFRTRLRPRLIILYYHAVPDEWVVNFDRQMQLLARYVRVVPADWRGDATQHLHNVAVTFDDAFESVIKNALPIMEKYGFHATIFVPSGCLGQRAQWGMETDIDRNERVTTPEQLRALSKERVTIGSHSITHARLTTLANNALFQELIQSRNDLNVLTRQDVTSLALPYGDYDSRVLQACVDSGYQQVFTIQPVPVFAEDFMRGRISVHADDGPIEFFLKAAGAYRWMALASAAKSKLLRRRLREEKPAGPTK
jgi:peptidoglycan/xylan/chitin deacetylase (PgdA/CDA1 family)